MEIAESVKPDASDALQRSEQGSPLSAQEIRLLSSIGFMAAKSGCLVPAVRIFEALAVLRPGLGFPFIGMSIAYLAVGMAGEAVHVLSNRALPSCSDQAELKLWLGLALQQAGNHAAACKELDLAIQDLSSDEMPPLAQTLAALLGARSSVPTWPTPAPVADDDLKGVAD